MPQISQPQPGSVADAPVGNWVDRLAPAVAKPYLRLARADRPIGTWLLLWPCWWSLALASGTVGYAYPSLWYLMLFAVGAWVMRGAGCTYNDIVDRDYDGSVARTALRPIPSGQVSVKQAAAFMVGLSLIGLLVLVQFNRFTIVLGISSLVLIAIYPFMKRFTYWPQVMLGLTFKWGALVGWAAVTGGLALPALLLYAGCVLWTVGYDTIYAHQDKEDDLALGLKSTALRLGAATHRWLVGFYAGAWVLWALAFHFAGVGLIGFTMLAMAALQMAWQVTTLDVGNADNCLRRFRSNRDLGWMVFAGLLGHMLVTNGVAV